MDLDVTQCSQAELKALRSKIDFLLKPAEAAAGDQQFFYSALTKELKDVTGDSHMPYMVFVKTSYAKKFKETWPNVDQFVKDSLKPRNRVEKLHFYGILAGALIHYVQASAGGPLTLRRLIDKMAEVGVAVDSQFPGYAAGGMLHLLLRKRVLTFQD